MDKVWQGAGLRRVRMLAGRAIRDVAAALDVNESAVSQWELGNTSPTQENLWRLAEYYGMELETLHYEIGYPVAPPPISLREWYARQREQPASENAPAPPQQNTSRPWGDTLRRSRGNPPSQPETPGFTEVITAVAEAVFA